MIDPLRLQGKKTERRIGAGPERMALGSLLFLPDEFGLDPLGSPTAGTMLAGPAFLHPLPQLKLLRAALPFLTRCSRARCST
jgi:hypothetical protein